MKKETNILFKLPPKLRTKQEIANLLNISYSTLLRRIKEADIPHRPNLLMPNEQEILLGLFGCTVEWSANNEFFGQ